jgi:hypothetical protein
MFWFKLWHRIRGYAQSRKPKFASDEAEIRWLMRQGIKDLRCKKDNLTSEQQARYAELTDRPFPEYMIVIK